MRHLLSLALLLVCVSFTWANLDENIKKLASTDASDRREAAQGLVEEVGPKSTKAIKPLIKALNDKDRFVRRFAAQALGKIGSAASEAVPALERMLQDDRSVRPAALLALSKMGPSAVPALARAAGKGNAEDVQEQAIDALAAAGKAGLQPLLNVIGDNAVSGTLRRKALASVQRMGRDAGSSAVPVITEVVKNPKTRDRMLRQEAVGALGTLARSTDTAAIKVLNDIVNDENNRDMGLKNQCRRALKQIQSRK